jgi:opacity protein-like surface antigen
MVRRVFFFFLVFLMALPVAMMAQDYPKAEVFGGYSYVRAQGLNVNGWDAAVAGNVNDWFGVKADFGGYYKNGESLYSFLFGPQFSYRKDERVTPFVHTLFGGVHATGDTSFAWAIGGGLDVKVADYVAVRIIQADYLGTRFGGTTQNNARLSFGIVFRAK